MEPWGPPNVEGYRGLGDLDREALGIPTEDEYVAEYCRRAGLWEVPHWTFLIAFCFFRSAAIHQGVYKRSLDGSASNPDLARKAGAGVPSLAKMGRRWWWGVKRGRQEPFE